MAEKQEQQEEDKPGEDAQTMGEVPPDKKPPRTKERKDAKEKEKKNPR